ncbi:unnamed protein product [Protopolystoma xenopodis]|uniref:Uncharacterized protein n=1 Tax=Protopolystoma xenopodis TaxID=117903 RepID=A0A3S4ZWA4_9PLAT|nr:unnamed protein product [Protopolystoma xenopodis]
MSGNNAHLSLNEATATSNSDTTVQVSRLAGLAPTYSERPDLAYTSQSRPISMQTRDLDPKCRPGMPEDHTRALYGLQ